MATALAVAAGSCTQETKVDISSNIRPEKMASMVTHNVNTLISDSGVTQYKIVAPVWYVYDEADTPYWSFPKGLYLQKWRQWLPTRHFSSVSRNFGAWRAMWR